MVRGIVIRKSFSMDTLMVTIIVNKKSIPYRENLIRELTKEITYKSIYMNINKKNSNYAFGEELVHLYGDEYLEEIIGDLSLEFILLLFSKSIHFKRKNFIILLRIIHKLQRMRLFWIFTVVLEQLDYI